MWSWSDAAAGGTGPTSDVVDVDAVKANRVRQHDRGELMKVE
jgi:hypothetical protein